jgi:hypothetical protein
MMLIPKLLVETTYSELRNSVARLVPEIIEDSELTYFRDNSNYVDLSHYPDYYLDLESETISKARRELGQPIILLGIFHSQVFDRLLKSFESGKRKAPPKDHFFFNLKDEFPWANLLEREAYYSKPPNKNNYKVFLRDLIRFKKHFPQYLGYSGPNLPPILVENCRVKAC